MGARGPRRQKPRRSKVNRQPYFVPWTEQWIYLPADRAHNMQVISVDEDGDEMGAAPVYIDKGYIPVNFASPDQLRSLPVNWKAVLSENAEPEYRDGYSPKRPSAQKSQPDPGPMKGGRLSNLADEVGEEVPA